MDNFDVVNENMRVFSAWATTDNVDLQGETVDMGDLEKYMPIFMDREPPLLLQHTSKVIGKILNYTFSDKEGRKGIKVIAKLFGDTAAESEVWEGIKQNKYGGLSIGGEAKKENGVLKNLKMWEISLVDKPANPEATIDAINMVAKSQVLCENCKGELMKKEEEKPVPVKEEEKPEETPKEEPKEEPEKPEETPAKEEPEKPEQKQDEGTARLEAKLDKIIELLTPKPQPVEASMPTSKAEEVSKASTPIAESLDTVEKKKETPAWRNIKSMKDI